jgi:hypothetical protein
MDLDPDDAVATVDVLSADADDGDASQTDE